MNLLPGPRLRTQAILARTIVPASALRRILGLPAEGVPDEAEPEPENAPPPAAVVCPNCKTGFVPSRPDKIYCSHVCQMDRRAAVKQPPSVAVRPKDIRRVQEIVAETYGIPLGMMIAETRQYKFSNPRTAAMALSRSALGASYPMIARTFGRKDHTTAMTAALKAAAWLVSEHPRHAAWSVLYRKAEEACRAEFGGGAPA